MAAACVNHIDVSDNLPKLQFIFFIKKKRSKWREREINFSLFLKHMLMVFCSEND